MNQIEGKIIGREKFGGYSRNFIIKTLEKYNKMHDKAISKQDFKLSLSISKMEIDFLNTILNGKK